jgi:hypothetical protein
MRSQNPMTETKVRAIVNSMQKFLTGQNIMMDGIQRSQNFVAGSYGWQIDAEGNAEFNDGTFRGTFNIGGTTITIDNTEDIQENLDIIDTAGGGTLYLQNGTYTLTADILIPSGVTLEGVTRDGVIFDCNSSYAIKSVGTNVYSTGTVTINNGDTTVVGSGTTFTSAMVGRYIWLDYFWYEITAFTDTTHITIDTFNGSNIAGGAYVISAININSKISKVTIHNATGSGFVGSYTRELVVDDILAYGCGKGIDLDYAQYPRLLFSADENTEGVNFNYVSGYYIDFSEANDNTANGITMTNTLNNSYQNTSCDNNGGDGLSLTSCGETGFLTSSYKNNGGQGIELVSGCNDNQFVSSVVSNNTSDGIKLTATNDRNTVVGVTIANNGGYGINIAASTCDNNQIIAPAFENNASGNINDSGTNTFISPQNTGSDIQTFTSSGTWTKPVNGSMVTIQAWAGGGSGGKNTVRGGGGGGGGGYAEITIPIASMGATETVTIGDGGASKTTNGVGLVGGNTTVGSLITAYGGGGGGEDSDAGGGGGGGNLEVGSVGGADGGAGGGILGGAGGVNSKGGDSIYGGGGGGDYGGTRHGGNSVNGGGGGGGEFMNGICGNGGNSINGGGGGGGGSNGTVGSGGTSKTGGAGGAGGKASNAIAGTQPAGGGGGSYTGNSGAGGKGKVIITTF